MLKSEARPNKNRLAPFLLYVFIYFSTKNPSLRSSHLLPSITSSSLHKSKGKGIKSSECKDKPQFNAKIDGSSFEKSYI